MKKIIIILTVLLIAADTSWAQISLETTFSSNVSLIKLHNSGYKYKMYSPNVIDLYNMDGTNYKTINIPTQSVLPNKVAYVTENLFDSDNDLEYFVFYMVKSTPPIYGYVYIYNEDGSVLFYMDSVSNVQVVNFYPSTIDNSEIIYYNGNGVKMRLILTDGTVAIYSLPGTIPCNECTAGVVSGISTNGNGIIDNGRINAVPNPSDGDFKIYYTLPNKVKSGELVIYSLQGQEMKRFKVYDTTDSITLSNTDLNSGTYLYSIETGSKATEVKKIIVIK